MWNSDIAIKYLESLKFEATNTRTDKSKSLGFIVSRNKIRHIAIPCERKIVVSAYINRFSANEEDFYYQQFDGIKIEKSYLIKDRKENGKLGIAASVARNNSSLHPFENDIYLIHIDNITALKSLIKWYSN